MPSDEPTTRALAALAGPRTAFRSAVAGALDAVAATLESRGAPAGERVARSARELGAFARGRIDAEAFAGLLTADESLDPAAVAALEEAREVLREILDRGDDAFFLEVDPGGCLGDVVAVGLAYLGRAFGAARTIAAVVAGRAPGDPADRAAFPFRRWSAAERGLAPPLVIEVDGADLAVAGLAEFLDGAVRIVLVVRGAAPPAALVRLVTPGVRVVQATDPSVLDSVAAAPGPAVAALVPESAARFVHDPAGGATIAERLTVEWLPEAPPRARIGVAGAFQQAEELAQLAALAAAPARVASAAGGRAADAGEPLVEPADRLAAWLLSRAELSDLQPTNGSGG